MAETENRQYAAGAQRQSGTESGRCANPSLPSRPRLGEAHDSWATVFKDMLREAPKTGLVVITSFVIAVINAIAYLCVTLAGCAGSPPDGPLIRLLHDAVVELFAR